MSDRVVVRLPAIALSLVAGILFWHTFDPAYASRLAGLQFGPMFFPRIILALWLCLALPMIVVVPSSVRNKLLEQRKAWPGIAFAVLLVTYVWLLPGLGYLITTFVFGVGVQLVAGTRNIVMAVIWSALIVGLSWVAFERLLEIILPSGRWI
ncbi:tripartite tricarboxylate transporter TctB family protein [Acuticoccus sp.]|uniref:tripartite tricarboxylate transporter TctB family protein n=1 Tax=Acuticoccus sp. TaxID=1904378 RepID=UPI003B51AA27